MTSWDWTSLLLLMLLNIDLSEQGCLNYLDPEGDLKDIPLLDLVPLMKAKNDNSTNVVICTLKNVCQNQPNSKEGNLSCNLLKYCIYQNSDKHSSDTSECEGKSGLNISLYHLTCLTAKIVASIIQEELKEVYKYEGCRYDNVCQLYSDLTPHAQTTTRPPSSTASERAPTAPSTLLPETTPTAPGTLTQKATTTASPTLLPKATPTAPCTMSPKATTTAPRTEQKTPTAPRTEQKTPTAPRTEQKTTTAPRTEQKTTTTAPTSLLSEGDKAQTSHDERIDKSNLMNLLFMSLTFNVVGPLLVYLYMRLRTQNQTPVGGPWEEVALTNMQFQNMHSGTGPENVQLMQITESASNITSTADPAQDGFTGRLQS